MDQDTPWPTAEDEAYDIRIARDGTWFYQGSPIGRPALVKLFSTVLKLDEAGDYWLITPAEQGRITVEDVPFLAVSVRTDGEDLVFCTNLDEEVTAGPDHPIVMKGDTPYIVVRDNLEARIRQAVYYELVELALKNKQDDSNEISLTSGGEYFSLGTVTPGS